MIAASVLAAALLGVSCKSDDGESQVAHSNTGGMGTGGPRNVGGTLSVGGSSVTGAGGDSDGSVSRDDACASSSDATEALPPVVQLVVDTSGSMAWPPGWAPLTPEDSKPPGATKWEITRDALRQAVALLADDIALGTSFFPNVQQQGAVCLQNEVAAPIALLGEPGARESWEAALSGVEPVGATPTHGAYLFGLQQLADSDLPGSRVLLLITDGTPTCDIECGCTEDNLPVDSEPLLAEATAANQVGVRTFVIGSPGSEQTRDVLSRLATEGGTARDGCSDDGPDYCHFDMTSEPDLAQGLAKALAAIGSSLRSCEYPIPQPPAGKALELDRVNVLYTPRGGDTVTIGRDPSEDACTQGWQYAPDGAHILLCGDACQQVREQPDSTVELLFGCETVLSEPK